MTKKCCNDFHWGCDMCLGMDLCMKTQTEEMKKCNCCEEYFIKACDGSEENLQEILKLQESNEKNDEDVFEDITTFKKVTDEEIERDIGELVCLARDNYNETDGLVDHATKPNTDDNVWVSGGDTLVEAHYDNGYVWVYVYKIHKAIRMIPIDHPYILKCIKGAENED